MFELLQVEKRYGTAVALAPTSLKLETGRTVVLIGPSGSGKSTLLRLVAGLETPTAGEVRFDGERVTADSSELRRRFGYVVQGGGLFPHLTARQNVELVARHLGWDRARRSARVAELAKLTRLPEALLDRYPLELSGGQAQRVSLLRALMLNPDVLLLDEPLGALDPMTRFELQGDLRAAFTALGKTVLLVTHDLAEAMYFADRVLLLKDGRVVQDGPPEALLDSPADDFVRDFVSAHRAPRDALEASR